ncbi:hypothetical protein SDC9_85151 [bioreactor metagenome]|uniref:Uncharacterized protein n=1 Tax=bioreactor metagenome TaxID=1076179 RepID=A0A644ZCA5_9ZZZZ
MGHCGNHGLACPKDVRLPLPLLFKSAPHGIEAFGKVRKLMIPFLSDGDIEVTALHRLDLST